MFFWPCIMNWLYINYQLDALIFIQKILFSSTCFEPQVLIFRRTQLYTCSIWYCHSLWEYLVACSLVTMLTMPSCCSVQGKESFQKDNWWEWGQAHMRGWCQADKWRNICLPFTVPVTPRSHIHHQIHSLKGWSNQLFNMVMWGKLKKMPLHNVTHLLQCPPYWTQALSSDSSVHIMGHHKGSITHIHTCTMWHVQQDRQYMCNISIRCIHSTIVAVEKQ